MILISSMGGCASTSLIGWVARRRECNCPLNSEGLRARGPGSNFRGLKHRQTPPTNDDKYLLRETSYGRDDISFGPIERALFLYDNPYSTILSLFSRRIAMGHAMAVTGEKPNHSNSLSGFLDKQEDSFGFYKQFDSWTNSDIMPGYQRMVVHFSAIWDNLEHILGFLGIDKNQMSAFPPKKPRPDRFNELDEATREKLIFIYGGLDDRMKKFPKVKVI